VYFDLSPKLLKDSQKDNPDFTAVLLRQRALRLGVFHKQCLSVSIAACRDTRDRVGSKLMSTRSSELAQAGFGSFHYPPPLVAPNLSPSSYAVPIVLAVGATLDPFLIVPQGPIP